MHAEWKIKGKAQRKRKDADEEGYMFAVMTQHLNSNNCT